MSQKSEIDRLPPHDQDAERAVLGCVILSQECLGECVERLKSGPETFYDLRNRVVFSAMVELKDEGRTVDSITLHGRLKDRNKLGDAGQTAYVSSLGDAVHSAASLSYYLDIVLEKFALRKLVQTCTSIVGRAMDCRDAIGTTLSESHRDVKTVLDDYEGSFGAAPKDSKQEAMQTVIAEWQWAFENPNQYSGIPSGLLDVDALTRGWQKRNLIVIGGRPSHGKSSLLFQCAEHAALNLRIPTLVVSLESATKEVLGRMAAGRAKASLHRLRAGRVTNEEIFNLTTQMGEIAKAPLWVVDRSGLTIGQVQREARAYVRDFGVKLIIVDYLQKIRADFRHEKKTYEIGEAAEGLKAMAKELDVPVVAAAQLNREPDKQGMKGRKPRLSDFGDSGQIEREIDVAVMIWHERKEKSVQSWLVVDKNRDGPTDDIKIIFNRELTRFENYAEEPESKNERRYND
jgi:replicative DNA helicase